MLARNIMPFTYAGILGFTGVAFGAFGAHALKARLIASNHLETWQTAVLYQLIHAVALIAIATANPPDVTRGTALSRAGTCWFVGVLLFSGSLYALALGAPKWFGPVTPLGGVALLLGWIFVMLHARRSSNSKR